MGRKQKKLIIVFIFICIISGVMGMIFLRFRNGTKLEAIAENPVQERIIVYRQDDETWAQDTLGTSQYTMESSGCVVSCIAAAVTMNGAQMTPGELNTLFSENDAYDVEGNLQWGKVDEIDGYNADVFSDVSSEIIEKCLSEGKYPIVRVRMQGVGNFHYVLIIGSEAGEYLCMDPLQDEVTKLSEYGNRVYAIRCVWYEKSEDILLYEAFYAIEYAKHDYLYTYFDCDNDGKLELLLKEREANDISMYIMKYEKNGLHYTYERDYEEIPVDELEWYDDVEKNEWVEEDRLGICVGVAGNISGENNEYMDEEDSMEHYWYLDEESFLGDFGFAETTPFYEYIDTNGNLCLTFYFDEQTEEGCGIVYSQYGGHDGFVFTGINKGEWNTINYLNQVSYNGETGADYVTEYEENYIYDSEGRVTHFDSTGFLDEEPSDIFKIDYEYSDDGHIEYRSYWQNARIFGSWHYSWDSYFDEQGRVVYEYVYITHGAELYYYIYSDDSEKPDYVLILDPGWGLEFIKY